MSRWALGLSGLVLILGCGGESPDFSQVAKLQADQVVEQSDPLVRACDYLNRQAEFEPERAQGRILFHLNQWIMKQPLDEQWQADPLFARLPKKFSVSLSADELTRRDFQPSDVQLLRACVWLRDISQSVVRREQERLRRTGKTVLAGEGFSALSQKLDARAVEDLQIATWLFDWTIRHIQLDPMPEPPAEVIGPQPDAGKRKDSTNHEIPPVRPSPGGRLTLRETLLLGHGDALERAKVFIGLARQQGMDVVMLHPDGAPERRGWLAAVLIGDQLFLFDTQLGIALPGPGGQPVATLAQVIADSSLIRALDMDGEPRYPLKHSEVEAMVAYVDASPEFLSQRMQLMEAGLPGDGKMVLTVAPGPLGKRLRRVPGIADVRLWLPPYETRHYRVELQRLLQRLEQARREANRELGLQVQAAIDRERLEQLDRELVVFTGMTPMSRGRLLQLGGQLDKQEDRPGAKHFLMECRPPEEVIAQLADSEAVRKQMLKTNVLPESEDAARIQRALDKQVALVRRMKQNATHWLGLIAYDSGQYQAAVHFFDQMTLAISEAGPWTESARYNLARAHEALAHQSGERHDFERAIELYQEGRSPQRLGNLLRAQRLAEELANGDKP